jgi:hypothetical protein
MPKVQEKSDFFRGIVAIMPSTRRFGLKIRNFGRFFAGRVFPKTNFGLRWPTLPHNIRYNQPEKEVMADETSTALNSGFGIVFEPGRRKGLR